MEKIEHKYLQAVDLIKKAILQSQYNAIRLANQEQLKLYFSIGRYISENSRRGFWGSGALDIISVQLKNDLPGLMGFGVTSLKNMRKFYEAWSELEDKSASTLAEFCRSSSYRVFGCPVYSAYPHYWGGKRTRWASLLYSVDIDVSSYRERDH